MATVGKKGRVVRAGRPEPGHARAWGPALTSTFRVFSRPSTGFTFSARESVGFAVSGTSTVRSTPLLSPVSTGSSSQQPNREKAQPDAPHGATTAPRAGRSRPTHES